MTRGCERPSFEQELEEFEATVAGGRPTDGLGISREFAKELLTRLRDCQAFIFAAFDEHGLELHDQFDTGECPQDDTCTCALATEANRLLKGWKGPATGAEFLAEAKRLGISLSADDLRELEENRG